MLAQLVLTAVLLLAGKADKGGDPALVGSWGLQGHTFMVLKADGSGSMEEDPLTWKADGSILTVTSEDGETDKASYKISGTQIAIVIGGVPMTLVRIGKGGADAAAVKDSPKGKETAKEASKPKETAKVSGSKINVNDSLSKLLLSSPWCSFHYNQTTGYSSTTRVVYGSDGTWSTGARGEGYSSGAGGTFASQHDSSNGGHWKVEQNQLYMSSADSNGQLVPMQLNITRNSNGYPIIKSNGEEYSQCQ